MKYKIMYTINTTSASNIFNQEMAISGWNTHTPIDYFTQWHAIFKQKQSIIVLTPLQQAYRPNIDVIPDPSKSGYYYIFDRCLLVCTRNMSKDTDADTDAMRLHTFLAETLPQQCSADDN